MESCSSKSFPSSTSRDNFFSESRNGFGSGVHFNFSNSGKVYSREALNCGPTAGHQGEDWGFHSVSGTGASHKEGSANYWELVKKPCLNWELQGTQHWHSGPYTAGGEHVSNEIPASTYLVYPPPPTTNSQGLLLITARPHQGPTLTPVTL